ncbi:MAG: extracellular solute-binding protein [Gammaproteobacteria bacterium]
MLKRRQFLSASAATAAALATPGGFELLIRGALAEAKGTINMADVGVADPGGDWSKYVSQSGWNVNLVAIGNAPSQVLNLLLTGGGKELYDLVSIVGGMQKPLVENDLVEVVDTGRIPNWNANTYIRDYIVTDRTGFDFAGFNGKLYMVPIFLQGDSIGYLPEFTGEVDSYGALFDPKFKGYTAIEDNFTTTGQKTAMYLKGNKLATIENPSNMTPSEFKAVVDFLIQKKKEGQFRLLWTSFEQSVNLFINKEVYVQDCWEPMVLAAQRQGVKAVYAKPKEGYLLWSYGPYIVKKERPKEREDAMYALIDFLLSPWYGAKITQLRGYLTHPGAPAYAKAHADEFKPDEAEQVAKLHQAVLDKFKHGGTWQQRWPTHIEVYEEEWARFRAA